jgi:hypothetical protein
MDRDEMDQLWGLPLEDFTRTRDDLSRKAKEEGDADGAKEIRALRKPTVAAWAVNQLARHRPDDIRRLLGLGEAMRRAQREAFEGGGREALRTATAERRRLVDQLDDAAEEVLRDAGHGGSRAVLDKVAETLTATVGNQAVGEEVGRGTLQREVTAVSGFDELAEMLPAQPAGKKASAAPKVSAATQRREREALERAEHLEAEADELEHQAKQARQEADRAAREARRLAGAAEELEERAAKTRERATKALRDVEP